MGAGVPRPCSAKRANASTSPGTPARIIIAPRPRVSSRPRNGGWSCQPVIDHGTSPASVHGATTKKTAEPRTAIVRSMAVPDTRVCELIPTSTSLGAATRSYFDFTAFLLAAHPLAGTRVEGLGRDEYGSCMLRE